MQIFPEDKPEGIRYTFRKEERLCSRKQIEKLFSDGDSFLAYPLKVIYTRMDFSGTHPVRAGFAVSTKKFKKATDRNLIKRRMREAYRQSKHLLNEAELQLSLAIMFIYVGKQISGFESIEKAMKRSILKLLKNPTPNP